MDRGGTVLLKRISPKDDKQCSGLVIPLSTVNLWLVFQ